MYTNKNYKHDLPLAKCNMSFAEIEFIHNYENKHPDKKYNLSLLRFKFRIHLIKEVIKCVK